MSLSNTTLKSGPFVIASLPATLATNFPFQVSADLLVLDAGALNTGHDPAVSLILNSDYSVTGGGYDSQYNLQTGSVVVNSGGANSVQVGDYIWILRTVPETQTTKFSATGLTTFPMVEEAFDKLTTLVLQLQEQLGRCLQIEKQEVLPTLLLNTSRLSSLLGFDSVGAISFTNSSTAFGTGTYLSITTEANIATVTTSTLSNPFLGFFVIGGSLAAYKLQTSATTPGTGVVEPNDNSTLRWIRVG
jgi:hypothetical protein